GASPAEPRAPKRSSSGRPVNSPIFSRTSRSATACPEPMFTGPRTSLPSIVEQAHEAEIHVKLLVAVEQRQPRIIGYEIDRDLLVAIHHHHVLHYACVGYARDAGQFEDVAGQVDGMNVIAGVAHQQAIAAALLQVEGWRRGSVCHGISSAVDGTEIEAILGGVVLGEDH